MPCDFGAVSRGFTVYRASPDQAGWRVHPSRWRSDGIRGLDQRPPPKPAGIRPRYALYQVCTTTLDNVYGSIYNYLSGAIKFQMQLAVAMIA